MCLNMPHLNADKGKKINYVLTLPASGPIFENRYRYLWVAKIMSESGEISKDDYLAIQRIFDERDNWLAENGKFSLFVRNIPKQEKEVIVMVYDNFKKMVKVAREDVVGTPFSKSWNTHDSIDGCAID